MSSLRDLAAEYGINELEYDQNELASGHSMDWIDEGFHSFLDDTVDFSGLRSDVPSAYPEQGPQQYNIDPNYDAYSYSGEGSSDSTQNVFAFRPPQPRFSAPPLPVRSRLHPVQSSHIAGGFALTNNVRPDVARDGAARQLGTSLCSTAELPEEYRDLFPFAVFNAVQSQCIGVVLHADDNLVVSAPTGSGKTVLFELAIIRMLMTQGRMAKAVYMAPTKALCSQKAREWEKKFQPLGIKCTELTGDTSTHGKGAWNDAKGSRVIITTPEKWDSLSRNWGDYEDMFSTIKLMAIDEVHLLNDNRGSTLEVCLTRTKIRAESRFVLVSATAPNVVDIANWIGARDHFRPAIVKQFGEEFRPCKLSRIVCAYPRGNLNAFQFQGTLQAKLFGLLQQHAQGKPVLVFCSTRKDVLTTAQRICKEYEQARTQGNVPWDCTSLPSGSFQDNHLPVLAHAGIGIHHAGLTLEDRQLTENLFLHGSLKCLFATSTLAVGVNLPAHTVIIKGVETWDSGDWREYSDLDVMQMMGRAGRPQFDKEGVAIVMCNTLQRQKYAQRTSMTTLESSLHLSINEHLNSEICLGSVTNVDTAKLWLRNTFLFHRIQKNPMHYGIAKDGSETWEGRFDAMVIQALQSLEKSQLISIEDSVLSPTDYGLQMSKLYIKQASMDTMLAIPEKASKRDILEAVCRVAEFKDFRLRAGEKNVLNKLCNHPEIRFPLKKVQHPADKVFILLQAILGGISLSGPEYKTGDSVLALEAASIYRQALRVIRAVTESAINRKVGPLLKYSFELLRGINAKAWEDRPIVLRQIESLGEKSIKVLTQYNITTLDALSKADPHRLELLLNRKSPFGSTIKASIDALPRFTLQIQEINVSSSEDRTRPIEVTLQVTCSAHCGSFSHKSKKKTPDVGMTSLLTVTSDLEYVDYRRIGTRALLKSERQFTITANLSKPSQSITVLISCENVAGMVVERSYKPGIDRSTFPVPNTRPIAELSQEEEFDLGEDPSVWEIDTEEEEDLTGVPRHAPPIVPRRTVQKGSTTRMSPVANGRECNHFCKDKMRCAHLCCKGGVKDKHKGVSSKPRAAPSSSKAIVQHIPRASQILSDLESLHQRTNTQHKLDPAQRVNITNRPSRPTNSLAADSKHDVASITPKVAAKRIPKSSLSTNLDSDDAKLDPSFFLKPMATKRALSSDQGNTKPRKKVKTEGPTDNPSKQRFPPAAERKHPPSSAKEPMLKGSLARIEIGINDPEMAPTASTLKSSSSSERLFFPRSDDQELATLERSPALKPKEVMRDYQEDHPFDIDVHPFEVTSLDPAPEVETAPAYSDGPSNSKPPTKNDAKDVDDGVHDWYKAVSGDEEAFDRLFSSIIFVDEPFE